MRPPKSGPMPFRPDGKNQSAVVKQGNEWIVNCIVRYSDYNVLHILSAQLSVNWWQDSVLYEHTQELLRRFVLPLVSHHATIRLSTSSEYMMMAQWLAS